MSFLSRSTTLLPASLLGLAFATADVVAAMACPAASVDTSASAEAIAPQRQQVGDEVSVQPIETAHPYAFDASESARMVHSKELHLPGATYIAPYFSRFDLADGDHVIVRSPDGSRQWRYENDGKPGLGRNGGFWGIHVPGDRLVIELHSDGREPGWGYRIDKVARGFADPGARAICGANDKRNAACYETSHPQIYANSRAVARLLINGTGLCTGWLVGSEGHLMTNNHCVGTQADAMNTNIEFMAQGDCQSSCGTLACAGTIVATQSTLVQTGSSLDYSLLRLPVNPSSTYGYLRIRTTTAVVDEPIYIPQHPGGRGKELAVESSHPLDTGGVARIQALMNPYVRYFADTEGGSSGSPVLGRSDHCVVVLHSGTFGCEHATYPGNTGTRGELILAALGGNVPTNATCGGDAIFANGFQ